MGHYCRICGCHKPNEKFSGKGHKNHICKACAKLPKEEIQAEENMNEIFNFLQQSNISKGNITRLHTLAKLSNEEVATHAQIVLEIAKIKPHKKRRLKFLARKNRELLNKLDETGLIMAHHY
ncbi:MAG: hypothetical protein KJ668_17695 [Proteobacteria bacterium]|nr:hypothetical protein [Pseudomonadota bacterium]